MLDNSLAPIVHRCLRPLAARLVNRKISANTISFFGFSVGFFVLPALYMENFWIALVIILINRLCDGLDGQVARLVGPTERGAFLDICFDFIFYALVPLGFALSDPINNSVAASVVIFSFIGSGSTFLAYSIVAERIKIKPKKMIKKGIIYLNGLTEGTETIIFLILICLFPHHFPLIAYSFSFLCIITTIYRLRAGYLNF